MWPTGRFAGGKGYCQFAASTPNARFTSPTVITAIWGALLRPLWIPRAARKVARRRIFQNWKRATICPARGALNVVPLLIYPKPAVV